MVPLNLRNPRFATVQEALAGHGYELRATSASSAKILRRGVQVGLWSEGKLEIELPAEELSRIRKSLDSRGLLESGVAA